MFAIKSTPLRVGMAQIGLAPDTESLRDSSGALLSNGERQEQAAGLPGS
jgi:hypothetical protein